MTSGRCASCRALAEKFGPFPCRLFDLWLADFAGKVQTTSIRFFDSIFYSYVGLSPPECTLLHECGNYLVVEHNGDVYPCDFFVEPRWRLGNIREGRLHDMLNSKRQHAFGAMKGALPTECNACRWLHHCRGGCIKDRSGGLMYNGVSHLCGAYKMFFEHADARLTGLAEGWKGAQSPHATPV